ncbi:MAG: ABC transporter substrate-binding protein [Acetatifactor sp.]|nr:ABC transporter substrate-binding protein [Acetatifactor sp.]
MRKSKDSHFFPVWRRLGCRGVAVNLCLAGIMLLTACGGQSGEAHPLGNSEQGAFALETPDYVPEGRQIVWIGDSNKDFSIVEAVAGFNESSDIYWAEIVSYGESIGGVIDTADQGAAINRIQIAMTTGTDCPDLMFIDPYWMNVSELVEQGYFEDLNPCLKKSGRLSVDDFMEGIPEAYTYNNRLITLPRYFRLELLVGKRSQLEQLESWTARDLFAYGEQYPDSVLVEGGDDPQYLLMIYGELMRLYENPPFVVEDNGRNVVDREQLAAFLEKIEKDARQSMEGPEYYPDYYAENRILLCRAQISWLWDIQMYQAIFGGDEMYVGYPSEDGRNIKITADKLYGIPYYAQNKEGAWAFLEYYLSQPQDTYNCFPSRKDAFEESLQRDQLHEGYEVNEKGVLVSEGTNLSMWKDSRRGWTFEAGEISQEDVEAARDMISRAGHPFTKAYTEMTWLRIMAEESGAYFAGQKTLQEVVDIIAARLQIYLDESASSDSAADYAQ